MLTFLKLSLCKGQPGTVPYHKRRREACQRWGFPEVGPTKVWLQPKKKKKVTRAKPSRNVLCDYHQALGRKKKKKKEQPCHFL